DFVGYTSVWLYAIGASYASYERSHIKADFVNLITRNNRMRYFCRIVAAAISTAMAAIFTRWSYDLVVFSLQINEKTHAYPLPMAIFKSSFFVGGILMTFYFLW